MLSLHLHTLQAPPSSSTTPASSSIVTATPNSTNDTGQSSELLLVCGKTLHLRRGLSRGGPDYVHPHPDEDTLIEAQFDDGYPDQLHSFTIPRTRDSHDFHSSSDFTVIEGSDTVVTSSDWNHEVQSGGQTTEHSSTTESTLSYDEFDKEASAKVRKMFDKIESCLFEEEPAGSQSLKKEYDDWTDYFPHHRILGHRYDKYEDKPMFACVNSDTPRPTTGSKLEDVTDQDLHALSSDTPSIFVEGKRMMPQYAASEHEHLREEVIEADGEYEDVIAIDSDVNEDELDSKRLHITHRRRRARYPPITPNACAKDDICNGLFDFVWTQLTALTRSLLQSYSQVGAAATAVNGGVADGDDEFDDINVLDDVDVGGVRELMLVGNGTGVSMAADQNRLPQIISLPRTDNGQTFGLGGFNGSTVPSGTTAQPRPTGNFFSNKQHSSLAIKLAQGQAAVSGNMAVTQQFPGGISLNGTGLEILGVRPAQALAAALDKAAIGIPPRKLDNILQISKKEMQTREATFTEETGSSTPQILKRASFGMRHSSANFSKGSRAGVSGGKPGRLAPLNDATRPPNVDDEYVQGKSLHMPNRRNGSPPIAGAPRGHALPPIAYGTEPLSPTVASGLKFTQKANRASSAVADENVRVGPKDKVSYMIPTETRPSTTHTLYLSDPMSNHNREENREAALVLKGNTYGNSGDHHAAELWGSQQPPGSAAYPRRKVIRQSII